MKAKPQRINMVSLLSKEGEEDRMNIIIGSLLDRLDDSKTIIFYFRSIN